MSESTTNFTTEQTLILLKPDALSRGLIGEIIARFERKNMQLVAMKMIQLSDAKCREHYSHLLDKPFFPRIAEFMTSTPVVALVIQGTDAVRQVRALTGVTDPQFAPAGTIRGDYSCTIDANLIHASDTLDNASIEIRRFFEPHEIFQYQCGSF